MIDRSEPATGVVVGVDGNPATLKAVDWAAREAGRRRLPLDLIQVLPPSERGPVLREPTGRAHALLEQARRIADRAAPDVAVRASVVDGVVGPALVTVAERAAVLVVGSRNAEGDLELTIGRTVAHVLGRAACPVVVVPQGWDPEQGHAGEVLVGVDGSAESSGAVAFAADVADRWRARLIAVAVGPRLGDALETETRRRWLAEAMAGLGERHPDVSLHEVVRHGTPSREIVDEAGHRARLLVLGSRGRGAFAGALLGSTSQAVVRVARCPVAVLPPRAAESWLGRSVARAGEGS